MNPTSIHEDLGSIPGQILVGRRHSSHLALLWCRPAAAAPIGPLDWEHPCATGAALLKKKNKKHNNHLQEKIFSRYKLETTQMPVKDGIM